MTLECFQKNWRNYAWEFRIKGKRNLLLLSDHYRGCVRRLIGRKKIPALSFYLRRNDGSWAHDFDILRCGENGACLQFTFLTRDITKFKWMKRGRLVKLGLSPAKLVLHHDDPPCEARLVDGRCLKCDLIPDMQSTSLYRYCPDCDVPLKNMQCPKCRNIFLGSR